MEAIVGGAGDDAISAGAVNATTGAAETTINSGDSVDGGLGTDTLTIKITAANNNSLSGLTVKNVEKVVLTGTDNLGTGAAAYAAAVTAKAVTAAALASATAGKVAADAAAVTATAQALAAAAVALIVSNADITTASTAGVAGTGYTAAQIQAAALAATTGANGVLITTAGAMNTRAGVLSTTAAAVKVLADAAVIAADAAMAPASFADTTAAANVTSTKAAMGIATVSALGTVETSADGVKTTVDGVIDGQTVTFAGAKTAANTVTFAAGTTAATIKLSGTAGAITLDDASTTTLTTTLKTVTVNGTVYGAAGSSTSHTSTATGAIEIKDDLGTAETVTTLNLGITNAATVTITDLEAKLATVNASTSTGNLTISPSSAKLGSVIGGSGNDTITATFALDVNGLTGPTSGSVDGGAGNDVITISGVGGTNPLTVAGGAGDDTVAITSALFGTSVTLNGGDGTDKLKFTTAGTTLSAGELALIAGNATSFERAEFVGATSLDASKVTQFTTLDLGANTAVVTKLADAQTINSAITAAITANGYVSVSGTAGTALALTATQYAGALTVNATGTATETVRATSLTLNVSNVKSIVAQSVGDQVPSAITLAGDVKTATVNLTGGNDYVVTPTSNDVISSITVVPNSSTTLVEGSAVALGALTALTLTGVGTATVTNSANSGTVAYTKLATIDASALGGTKGALAGSSAGQPLGGLIYTGNSYLVETVTLGAGLDKLIVNSTYDKTDTITGLKLVTNTDLTLNHNLSDQITAIGGGYAKLASDVVITGTTLGVALVQIAALATDSVVFQFGGDTYIFTDGGSTTALEATDGLVKLTGLVDVPALVLALNYGIV